MDFRQRLEQSRPGLTKSELQDEPEDDFRSEYYAIDNIRSHPACLDFRMKEGSRRALPYSYFMEINFDNETGIEIFTATKKIKIVGRNLSKLFDYLVTYRVRYIQANIGNDQKEEGLFVKEILIEELNF